MEALKKHIIFKILSAVIALTLLVPEGIKLVHIFEHDHFNYSTIGDSDNANFYECEIDCPLVKYNLQHYVFKWETLEVRSFFTNNFEVPIHKYQFFYNYNNLSISLRGPPVLV